MIDRLSPALSLSQSLTTILAPSAIAIPTVASANLAFGRPDVRLVLDDGLNSRDDRHGDRL